MICHKEPGTKIILGDFSMHQKKQGGLVPHFLNPYCDTGLFLYLLKTSEHDIWHFQRVYKVGSGMKWVNF